MSDLRLDEIKEIGRDNHRGNLLGIQPFMIPSDYATEDIFSTKLDSYLTIARQKGWLTKGTIVVWPEGLATWLICTGEGQAVYQAPTMSRAMRALVLNHALPFARNLMSAREKDKVTASLLRTKAKAMAHLYQATFSKLSQQYAVTMVAGSIWLPSPHVKEGRIEVGNGPLYHVSAIYGPDGLAHTCLVRKAFLSPTEMPFIASGSVVDLPVFNTPAGKLGVLICADSWYPAAYEQLRAAGVELIAVQSFVSGSAIWEKPWRGYSGSATPGDVEPSDLGSLTEGQAWRKYALAGRRRQAGAKCGINIFLHGAFWDLDANSGCSMTVSGDEIVEVECGGAALLNLWV